MDTNNSNNKLQAKSIIRVMVITALILLVPFLAMQFNWQVIDPGNPSPEQVNWNLFDFVVMGILLLGIGFTYEFLATKANTTMQKAVLALVLLGVFMLIWAELAVGVFGTPFAGS